MKLIQWFMTYRCDRCAHEWTEEVDSPHDVVRHHACPQPMPMPVAGDHVELRLSAIARGERVRRQINI